MPALSCARDLARIFASQVHLLHVSPEPATQGWGSLMPGTNLQSQAEKWRIDATAELAAFARQANPPGTQRLGRLGPTLAVRISDDAPAAILAYAREAGCDLIVMGTHPASTISLLRGSTADWVRRYASCPVILVPPTAEACARSTRTSPDVEAEFAMAP